MHARPQHSPGAATTQGPVARWPPHTGTTGFGPARLSSNSLSLSSQFIYPRSWICKQVSALLARPMTCLIPSFRDFLQGLQSRSLWHVAAATQYSQGLFCSLSGSVPAVFHQQTCHSPARVRPPALGLEPAYAHDTLGPLGLLTRSRMNPSG